MIPPLTVLHKLLMPLQLFNLRGSLPPLAHLVVVVHKLLILSQIDLIPEPSRILHYFFEVALQPTVFIQLNRCLLLFLLYMLRQLVSAVKVLNVLLHLRNLLQTQLFFLSALLLFLFLLLESRHFFQSLECRLNAGLLKMWFFFWFVNGRGVNHGCCMSTKGGRGH